jgi:hypothetical protein
MVRILDSNFTLQANETKDARFEIIVSEPGRYDGKIYVSFNPDGENVNESGVGLASNIIIFAKDSTKPEEPLKKEERSLAVPIIVLCLMIIVGVGVYHVRSKK